MKSEVQKRFIKMKVEETRCPELIRRAGVEDRQVYLLRERIECDHWQRVAEYFVQIRGKHIVAQPTAARSYFTVEPENVVATMKSAGL